MKTKFLCAALAGLLQPLCAAPLTESTFTEIVREVNVVDNATSSAVPAQTNNLLKAPDRVRTGPQSRAELTAADKTITRVGANTVFAYADSGRTLNLEKGSLLFHSPKGLGGGTIKSGGAAAAVLGTTLMVSATADGGFKVIMLEGSGRVTLPNGNKVVLHAGQLVFVAPNGTELSDVLNINLGKLIAGSLLVNGFGHPLPSWSLIQTAIDGQNGKLAAGDATDTGTPPKKFHQSRSVPGNGLNAVDPGTYQNAAHAPLTPGQITQLIDAQDPAKVVFGTPGGRGFSPVVSQ